MRKNLFQKITLSALTILLFSISSSSFAADAKKTNRKPASDVQVMPDSETKGAIITFSGDSAAVIYKALKGNGGSVNGTGISCSSSTSCMTNMFPDGSFHPLTGE